MRKVWVTRDRETSEDETIFIWPEESYPKDYSKKKHICIQYDTVDNDFGIICEIVHEQFLSLFGWVPEEGSCELYELSDIKLVAVER